MLSKRANGYYMKIPHDMMVFGDVTEGIRIIKTAENKKFGICWYDPTLQKLFTFDQLVTFKDIINGRAGSNIFNVDDEEQKRASEIHVKNNAKNALNEYTEDSWGKEFREY